MPYTASVDPRADQARDEHRLAQEAGAQARRHRESRDDLIRQLSAAGWGYARIATQVGCSRELVRSIVTR